jgi:hypothetical protein
MYCICCKRNNVLPMEIAYPNSYGRDLNNIEEDLLWKNEKDETSKQNYYRTIENEMVDNGGIEIVNLGYGSRHDGDRILLAICDACITENLADGTLLYFSNYMTNIGVEGNVEKSKKLYQRRTRLDGLVGEE